MVRTFSYACSYEGKGLEKKKRGVEGGSLGQSLIGMVFHFGVLLSGWPFIRVVFHKVVFHQGGSHQGGLSSEVLL